MLIKTISSLFSCSQGSLVVEAAIALPLLVILLFGSFDLVCYVQAVSKLDIAANVIANALRDVTEINDADLPRYLAMAERNLTFGEFSLNVGLVVEGFQVSPDGSNARLWFMKMPNSESCQGFAGFNGSLNAQEYIPSQYLITVKLCAEYGANFFLSSLIPTSAQRISSLAIRHANHVFELADE